MHQSMRLLICGTMLCAVRMCGMCIAAVCCMAYTYQRLAQQLAQESVVVLGLMPTHPEQAANLWRSQCLKTLQRILIQRGSHFETDALDHC